MTKHETQIHNTRHLIKHKKRDELLGVYKKIEQLSHDSLQCIIADEYNAIATLKRLNAETRKAIQLNLEIIELESKLKELLS